MKPRPSLCVISLSVLLAVTCTGVVGAAPINTRASIPTPPTTWFGQYYDNAY